MGYIIKISRSIFVIERLYCAMIISAACAAAKKTGWRFRHPVWRKEVTISKSERQRLKSPDIRTDLLVKTIYIIHVLQGLVNPFTSFSAIVITIKVRIGILSTIRQMNYNYIAFDATYHIIKSAWNRDAEDNATEPVQLWTVWFRLTESDLQL